MKASFTLFGLFATALAAPVLDISVNAGGVIPTTKVDLSARAVTVSSVVTILKTTLSNVTSEAEVIAGALVSSQDEAVVGQLVVSELKTVTAAVSSAMASIKTLDSVVDVAASDVQEVATLLFSIIGKVVSTVTSVTSSLGVSSLLTTMQTDLGYVVFDLLQAVELVVGGVLVIVNNLINVNGLTSAVTTALPTLLSSVDGLLSSLP